MNKLKLNEFTSRKGTEIIFIKYGDKYATFSGKLKEHENEINELVNRLEKIEGLSDDKILHLIYMKLKLRSSSAYDKVEKNILSSKDPFTSYNKRYYKKGINDITITKEELAKFIYNFATAYDIEKEEPLKIAYDIVSGEMMIFTNHDTNVIKEVYVTKIKSWLDKELNKDNEEEIINGIIDELKLTDIAIKVINENNKKKLYFK